MALYIYPEKTIFNRRIARSKIYENTTVSAKVKKQFKEQLESIYWAHKLSQDTLNLEKTEQVPEVVILRLKVSSNCSTEDISKDVLKAIDESIPLPIIYEIINNDKIKMMGIYKRPSESVKSKWKIQGEYLSSGWSLKSSDRQMLPITSNLQTLYEKLLSSLLPIELPSDKSIEEQLAHMKYKNDYEKKLLQLNNKLKNEKQFNRKIDIQQQINLIQSEINSHN